MSEKVSPFSNGSQYMDWQGCNCERCVKSVSVWDVGGDATPTCEIELALMEAEISDGEVTQEIAQRMGYEGVAARYVWPCTEVEWTEEWKAEWFRRHPEKVQP